MVGEDTFTNQNLKKIYYYLDDHVVVLITDFDFTISNLHFVYFEENLSLQFV